MSRRGCGFWQHLVVELERSKLTQVEFARERRVPVATLRSWIYRLRREAALAAPPLVPVRVVASTAPSARWQDGSAGAIEAVTPSGFRLRFQAGIDVDYVAELLRRLG
jgi:hypothetical protein